MRIKKVIDAIRANKSFMVSSHINLEGDSLGSLVAMYSLLKKMGKKAWIVVDEEPARIYKFISKGIKIYTRPPEEAKFDAVIILDSPSIDRIGRAAKYIHKAKTIINIDHHVSNIRFGDVNWVEPKASSVGEMLYKLFVRTKQKIDRIVAEGLYIAILTDTGSFRYGNTAPGSFEVAADLLRLGVKPHWISEMIYERSDFNDMKLLGMSLATLQRTKDGKIAWLCVTDDMFRRTKTDLSATERFVDFPRSIDGVKVAMFFKKVPGSNRIKVSFRSKGKADVNKIAKAFGGGGHKAAAGCEVKGSLENAVKKIIKEVRKEL